MQRLITTLTLLISLTAATTLHAQANQPARRVISGSSLPANCLSSVLIKDVFYKTGSSAGLYVCTSPSTWTGPITVSTGDVVGPASSTDNAVARYDLATGKLLQDSLATLDDAGQLTAVGLRSSSGLTLTTGGNEKLVSASNLIRLGSDMHFQFYNDPDIASGAADVGLKRSVAGRLQITDGAAGAGALDSPTLITPTIADYTNAAHDHGDADDAGQIAGATALSEGTTGTGAFVRAGSPTFTGAPVLAAPTATTIETSGNVGLGVAPSATNGLRLLATQNGNQSTTITASNSEAVGTSATAGFAAEASTARGVLVSYGAGSTLTLFGVASGSYSTLLSTAGNGLLIGATNSASLRIGTNNVQAMHCTSGQLCGFGLNVPDGAGKLQVQMGSSTANAKVGGSEWYSVTEAGNVGTGEDALIPAESIEAASLTNDGASISFRAFGSTANNANVKRIRVRLIEGANNTVIYDAGAAAIITNSDWVLECEVLRESATVFKSSCSLATLGVSGLAYADYTTGTYTFANAGTIGVTAEATSDNDVVMEGWKGYWDPAP